MPRTSKKDLKIKDELAALNEPDYVPTTTREMDAPANLRKLEFSKLRYDYDSIEDEETRYLLQDAAVDINMRRERAAKDIFEIGKRLLEIQEAIPKHFTVWIETEFDYSMKTAQEYMNIARRFADNPALVSGVPATVLRIMASPSLPDEGVVAILEAFEEKAEQDETLKIAEARAIADEYRPEEDKRPRRERIARTIAGQYSVQKTDDVIVKTLVEAPGDQSLADALHNANKEQLQKALTLLPPDDLSRQHVLDHAIRQYDRLHPQEEAAPVPNGTHFQAPSISTRKVKDGVLVELPRVLWGKILDAFKQFDMNPVISDKESARILKVIETSLETQ